MFTGWLFTIVKWRNFNFKVENFVWSSIHFVTLKLQFESQGSEFHGYLLSPFLLFCPKVWDPICWEDIYVSFQPSFVSSVISDEPTCLAILRKIMASPIQNVAVAFAHWTKMVFHLVFAKGCFFSESIVWLFAELFRFLPYIWFGCFLYIPLP